MDNVVVFSLNSSKELTEKICKKLGIKQNEVENNEKSNVSSNGIKRSS